MIESVKHGTRQAFETGVFGSKITLIILLMVLSFVNADVSFIKEKPRMFLFESVVVGLSAGVPFTYIALNRGKELGDAVSLGVTAFLIFFLFHVVMEFSGQNQAMIDKEKLTDAQKKQQDVVEKVTKLKATKWIIGAIVVFMILLALAVRDVDIGVGTMMKEALLMATCGALPTIMIARDRDEKDGKKIAIDFFTYFGMFFAGHVALQMGGFYTHLFLPKADEDGVVPTGIQSGPRSSV
jgi:hypothetical protein